MGGTQTLCYVAGVRAAPPPPLTRRPDVRPAPARRRPLPAQDRARARLRQDDGGRHQAQPRADRRADAAGRSVRARRTGRAYQVGAGGGGTAAVAVAAAVAVVTQRSLRPAQDRQRGGTIVEWSPTEDSAARRSMAEDSSAQYGTAWLSTAQHGTAWQKTAVLVSRDLRSLWLGQQP